MGTDLDPLRAVCAVVDWTLVATACRRHADPPQSRRVYVGFLPEDVRSSEIKDLFGKFGPIRDIDIKAPRAPGRLGGSRVAA